MKLYLQQMLSIVINITLLSNKIGGKISLTLTSSDDVLSNKVLCPNIDLVEFTCVAVEVAFLDWSRNGTQIGSFNTRSTTEVPSQVHTQSQPAFLLVLDTNDQMIMSGVANITSRLIANITDLSRGDQIQCSEPVKEEKLILNYSLRSAPPAPSSSVYYISSISTTDFSVSFISTFISAHAVNSYRVVASGGSAAVCPSSCSPSGPCRCTGLVVGESVNITISAINCGDQEGPGTTVQLDIEVPSKPPECSHVPIYNSQKELIMVEFYWAIADNPPIALGLNQSMVNYTISLDGIGTQEVSASTACPMAANNCSFSYPVPSHSFPSSPLTGGVAAENIVGVGERCSPSNPINPLNVIFSLSFATMGASATVQCLQLSGSGTFDCQFCYGLGTSCQNLHTCAKVGSSATFLYLHMDTLYCYRATASLNEIATSVIQDTMSFHTNIINSAVVIGVSVGVVLLLVPAVVIFVCAVVFIRHAVYRPKNCTSTEHGPVDMPLYSDITTKKREMDGKSESQYAMVNELPINWGPNGRPSLEGMEVRKASKAEGLMSEEPSREGLKLQEDPYSFPVDSLKTTGHFIEQIKKQHIPKDVRQVNTAATKGKTGESIQEKVYSEPYNKKKKASIVQDSTLAPMVRIHQTGKKHTKINF